VVIEPRWQGAWRFSWIGNARLSAPAPYDSGGFSRGKARTGFAEGAVGHVDLILALCKEQELNLDSNPRGMGFLSLIEREAVKSLRFNHRNQNIYKVLLKIIRTNPLF